MVAPGSLRRPRSYRPVDTRWNGLRRSVRAASRDRPLRNDRAPARVRRDRAFAYPRARSGFCARSHHCSLDPAALGRRPRPCRCTGRPAGDPHGCSTGARVCSAPWFRDRSAVQADQGRLPERNSPGGDRRAGPEAARLLGEPRLSDRHRTPHRAGACRWAHRPARHRHRRDIAGADADGQEIPPSLPRTTRGGRGIDGRRGVLRVDRPTPRRRPASRGSTGPGSGWPAVERRLIHDRPGARHRSDHFRRHSGALARLLRAGASRWTATTRWRR